MRLYIFKLFYFSAYQSGERDVIRPLKFARLNATCRRNVAAVDIFTKDLFHTKINISTEQAEEILQIRENYVYKRRPSIAAGKLCDITVDKEAFKKAILETQKRV